MTKLHAHRRGTSALAVLLRGLGEAEEKWCEIAAMRCSQEVLGLVG